MAALRLITFLVAGVACTEGSAQECGWEEIALSSQSPVGRSFHAMAYDNGRGVTVLFGGTHDRVNLDDTWEWNGVRWTLVATNGPSARSSHAMAYDSSRSVTVLFGGYESDETWEWDGVEWRLMAVTGPSWRRGHAMAYDNVRGVTVLFGGQGGDGEDLNDTWEWDGAQWKFRTSQGPGRRHAMAMAFDSRRAVTVLFGGVDNPERALRDTWEWDGTQWTYRTHGAYEALYHTLAYDADRGVTVLVGGQDYRDPSTWEWDGDVWFQTVDGDLANRRNHAMVYDAVRQTMFVFGGAPNLDDMFEYSCTRSRLAVNADCPDGRTVNIEWLGATPDSPVVLLYAHDEGSLTIPQSLPCAGMPIRLGPNHLQLIWHGPSNISGGRTLRGTMPRRACGGFMQLVDSSTCLTSNVAEIQ